MAFGFTSFLLVCESEDWGGAEVQLVEGVAVGVVAGFADGTVVAEGEGAEDWIALLGYGDIGSDFTYVARACICLVNFCVLKACGSEKRVTFMSENSRIKSNGSCAGGKATDKDVCMADTRGDHLDQQLALAWLSQTDLFHLPASVIERIARDDRSALGA